MRALVSGALGAGIVLDEPFRVRFTDGRTEVCSAQDIRMLTQGCSDLQELDVQDEAALDAVVHHATRFDRLIRLARIALDPTETSDLREDAKAQYQLIFGDDISLADVALRLEALGTTASSEALLSLLQTPAGDAPYNAARGYYEILGVAEDADAVTIKSAFRRLAMKMHPDQNPGSEVSEEKFKEIGEAFVVLSDPEKRAQYDRFGRAFQNGEPGFGPGVAGFGDFSDLFNEIFGGGFEDVFARARSRSGPARGGDLRYDVEITLEQAFRGSEREIVVPRAQACEPCSGTGSEGNAPLETCPTCDGAGEVRAQQAMSAHQDTFRVVRTCPACHGRGQSIKTPCRSCGGRGLGQRVRTLSVKIPAGVEDGARIRFAGEGDAGLQGAPPGDLYLFLSIRTHALFERDGPDLYCRAPAPIVKVVLGGEMEIATIDGERAKITIPPGTQTGRRFRVKGKGMPNLRGKDRGDLHVELLVETPVNLTAEQSGLFEEFAKSCGEEVHPQSQGFSESVKEFLEANSETRRR